MIEVTPAHGRAAGGPVRGRVAAAADGGRAGGADRGLRAGGGLLPRGAGARARPGRHGDPAAAAAEDGVPRRRRRGGAGGERRGAASILRGASRAVRAAGAGDVPAGVSRRRRSRRRRWRRWQGGADPASVGRGSLLPPTMEARGRERRWTGPSATGSSRRWRRSLPAPGRGRSRRRYGSHLVRLEEAEPAVAPAFEEVRAAVEDGLAAGEGGGAGRGRATGRCGGATRWCCRAGAAVRRLLRLVGLLVALAGPAAPHELQPGFLDLQALGGEAWRVYWKVPAAGAGPLPIEAVLPEACAPRRPEELRFDGAAFVAAVGGALPGRARGRGDPDRGAGADRDRRAGPLRAGAGRGREPAADGGDDRIHGAGAAGAAGGAVDLFRARGRPYPARGRSPDVRLRADPAGPGPAARWSGR